MFESTGKVIEVQKFSDAEDQITIEIKVPEPLGEEGETRSHDWIVSHRNRESGGCCKNRDQSALTPSDVDRLIGQMGHTDPATFLPTLSCWSSPGSDQEVLGDLSKETKAGQ
jgi:hypothetical protein